jgi:hypothetical protein
MLWDLGSDQPEEYFKCWNLLNSPSREVSLLARIVYSDPRSTTCVNLRYLEHLTGLSQSEHYSSFRVRAALPVKEVLDHEKKRLGLITNLFKMKNERYLRVEDSKSICAMLDSLCST